MQRLSALGDVVNDVSPEIRAKLEAAKQEEARKRKLAEAAKQKAALAAQQAANKAASTTQHGARGANQSNKLATGRSVHAAGQAAAPAHQVRQLAGAKRAPVSHAQSAGLRTNGHASSSSSAVQQHAQGRAASSAGAGSSSHRQQAVAQPRDPLAGLTAKVQQVSD